MLITPLHDSASLLLLLLTFTFTPTHALTFPNLNLASAWARRNNELATTAMNQTNQPTTNGTAAQNGTEFLWLSQDEYSGKTFFDRFSFFNDFDPTHGTVDYVNSTYAFANRLAYVNDDGTIVMKGDDTTWLPEGQNRSSVRITSVAQYNTGLFILDLNRAPWGCVGAGQWPYTGEIDIIPKRTPGVHDNSHNQVTWHTGPGCFLTPETNYTGTLVNNNLNCDGNIPGNAGCGITEWSRASYGPLFDQQGGGVFAMKWDETGIAVWSFYRSAIPRDIVAGTPNPANWGLPVASLAPETCDPLTFFVNHSIVFGDWAGNSYASSGCPGSCTDRLRDPNNFVNASWSINWLKVYKKQFVLGRASSAESGIMRDGVANAGFRWLVGMGVWAGVVFLYLS
ncbi:hypothetical protein R3P38DRAFT_2924945 [Favolaschia claudopus]|uniref:GH16 domain-containing protein n=1 Tax=Favolaschia claudopus TaxID=2862362 RepID=A0AAW0C0M8_9AGAR